MDSQQVRPGRGYYVLAAIVFLAGLGCFVLVLWRGLSGMSAMLQQAVAPGQSELILSEPGDYTVFYEHESVIGNRVYSTGEAVPGLICELDSKSTGKQVRLRIADGNTTYSFGGRSGRSALYFHIDRPGAYVLTTNYSPGREGPEVVLAVGRGISLRIVTTVFESLGILFGSLLLSMAITVVTLVKRHNARKRLNVPGAVPPPIE
jgi:hypothetical protein